MASRVDLRVSRINTIDAKTPIKDALVAAWGNFSMPAGRLQAA